MNDPLVDTLMVGFALIYNAILIAVFILRAHERVSLEWKLGYVFSGLLIPFTLLWLTNLLVGSDTGRLITSLPVIGFLVYDLWYRMVTQKKPLHHPERWPINLYIYVILYQFGSIILIGYAFLVSILAGFLVLAFYYGSLAAFGYYQYRYKKKKRATNHVS